MPWADFRQKGWWWNKGQGQQLSSRSQFRNKVAGWCVLLMPGWQLNFSDIAFSSSFEKYPRKIPRHLKQCLFSKVDEVSRSNINPVVLSIYQLTAVNWSRDRLTLHFETEVHDVGPKANGGPVTWLMSGALQRLKNFIRAGRTLKLADKPSLRAWWGRDSWQEYLDLCQPNHWHIMLLKKVAF